MPGPSLLLVGHYEVELELPKVFEPEFRLALRKLPHQVLALVEIQIDYLYAVCFHELPSAPEGLRLPHHDLLDSEPSQ